MDFDAIVEFGIKFVYNALIALVLGVISIFVGNIIPRKWIRCEWFPFKSFFWEREGKTYHLLRIELWKNRLPDISVYVNSVFPKKMEAEKIKDTKYFYKFAKETCIAELVHFILIFVSPLYFWLNWDEDWGLAAMIINIVCNIPFIIAQRYNRPRLLRVIKRRERLAAHAKTETEKETVLL